MKRSREAGSSDRAARTGQGKWDLAEASGALDRDYATIGVLGRGAFSEVRRLMASYVPATLSLLVPALG